MYKKLITIGIGIALLASPVLVSAQTTSTSNGGIIAILEQLVATLTQELEQLIAGKSSSQATSTPTQSTTVSSNSFANLCASYAHLQKGNTDAATGGQVTQLQSFVGISPTTGYYGAQTAIAYQNKCGNLGNSQPTSVAGMSEYTDSSFGFSFWYPSSWTVTPSTDRKPYYSGSTFIKSLALRNGSQTILISEYTSPSGITITEGTFSDRDYFDASSQEWVYTHNGQQATPEDTSMNTMGGLHIFGYGIVPLSASNFVVIDSNGASDPVNTITKTIVATNPAVAVPVSTVQQTATIQAEANAYGVNTSSSSNASTGFTASPTSGPAPLTVTFITPGFVLENGKEVATTFDSGDKPAELDCTAAAYNTQCGGPYTYTLPGTYVAKLEDSSGNVLSSQTITVIGSSTSSLQTYTNSQYGFSVQYPSTLTVNPTCSNDNSPESCSSQKLISFYAADSNSVNGFANGYVVVQQPSAVGRCMSDPGNGIGTYSTKTINGITFGVYGIGSAAAGTQEAMTTYSTERNGLCYSITEDEYSHYTGGTYGNSQAKTNLESIVQSFRFTQ